VKAMPQRAAKGPERWKKKAKKMDENAVKIRLATLEDAARLLEIYSYYVEHTAITFEYETPTLEEFRARMTALMKKYPYLVAERAGKIVGYAYAGPFHVRAAYHWASELTIYLDRERKGEGRKR